jgi:hypothetical protein
MENQFEFRRAWPVPALLALLLVMPEARAQAGITVVTQPATSITTTGAILNGTVNGNGEDIAAVYFDYGPALPYSQVGLNAVPFNVTAAQGLTPVTLAVGGLACATPYHFRVTADDSNGRNTKGADIVFTTARCPSKAENPVPTLSTWSLLALMALVALMASSRRWLGRPPRE